MASRKSPRNMGDKQKVNGPCCASTTDPVEHTVRIRTRLYPCLYVTAAREGSPGSLQAMDRTNLGTKMARCTMAAISNCSEALIFSGQDIGVSKPNPHNSLKHLYYYPRRVHLSIH